MANPWVFGYGSLIWNPGFAYLRAEKALLRGAHRSLSVYSFRHRGTPEAPGLVFGLRHGGACPGLAFEVDAPAWPEVFAYLEEREQDRGVYRHVWRDIGLADRRSVHALTYIADTKHAQFAGRLPIVEQVRLIMSAVGISGRNIDYVRATAAHLARLGIRDKALFEIVAALDAVEGQSAETAEIRRR